MQTLIPFGGVRADTKREGQTSREARELFLGLKQRDRYSGLTQKQTITEIQMYAMVGALWRCKSRRHQGGGQITQETRELFLRHHKVRHSGLWWREINIVIQMNANAGVPSGGVRADAKKVRRHGEAKELFLRLK